MMFQPWKNTTAIHILQISQEVNAICWLIEYNMRSTFLEISYTKYGGETIHKPFSKNSKFSISLDLGFYNVYFYCMSSWGLSKYFRKSCRFHAFTSLKAFLKNKRNLELVSLASFLHNFWKKIFLLLYSINWPYFNCWLSLLHEIFIN